MVYRMGIVRRNILDIILPKLRREQALVLTGARQTGETTLCEVLIPQEMALDSTYISFDDPDERLRFQNAAVPILESMETPLIILDEVQKTPALFDPLKYVVDKQKRKTAQGNDSPNRGQSVRQGFICGWPQSGVFHSGA